MFYHTKPMCSLSDRELESISELYSENYGVYSSFSSDHAGEKIRYSVNMYKRNYVKDSFYISYAETMDGEVIGAAVYIRKKYSRCRVITWVVQLVVDKEYRGHGIAGRLLQSIWGFSNDYAWGLATTNPLTIKTLEAATLRKVSLSKMEENIKVIKITIIVFMVLAILVLLVACACVYYVVQNSPDFK